MIPVRQILVTLALLFLVTGIVIAGLWYQQCNCQPYKDAEGNYHPVVGNLLCDTIRNPEAVFALALVICTVISFGFITTQIAQTNEALRISERANDFAEIGLGLANIAIEKAEDANKAAVRAATATESSVDKFLKAERGILAMRDSKVIQAPQTATPPDPLAGWTVHHVIE